MICYNSHEKGLDGTTQEVWRWWWPMEWTLASGWGKPEDKFFPGVQGWSWCIGFHMVFFEADCENVTSGVFYTKLQPAILLYLFLLLTHFSFCSFMLLWDCMSQESSSVQGFVSFTLPSKDPGKVLAATMQLGELRQKVCAPWAEAESRAGSLGNQHLITRWHIRGFHKAKSSAERENDSKWSVL